MRAAFNASCLHASFGGKVGYVAARDTIPNNPYLKLHVGKNMTVGMSGELSDSGESGPSTAPRYESEYQGCWFHPAVELVKDVRSWASCFGNNFAARLSFARAMDRVKFFDKVRSTAGVD